MRTKIALFSFVVSLLTCTFNQAFSQDEFDAIGTFEPLVQAWNQAIDEGDLAALEKMYAQDLYVYGSNISKSACLASKRQFFERNPNYSQKAGELFEVRMPFEGRFEAYFPKTSIINNVEKQYRAVVMFDRQEDGRYLVVGESDATSDKNTAKRIKGKAFADGHYCFVDNGIVFNNVAIPARYDLRFDFEVKNKQVTGSGEYYSPSMRTYYSLNIKGETHSNGVVSLRLNAEGPLYPDDPKDVLHWEQEWKYAGYLLRWMSGDPPISNALVDQDCE